MKYDMVSAISFAGVLATLYVAASFFPGSTTWGVHSLAYLGPVTSAGFLFLVFVMIYAARDRRTGTTLARVASFAASRGFIVPAAALGLFIIAGLFFRIRAPLLGDSWFLVRNFAGSIQGTDTLLPRDEPLATYYFSVITNLFGVKTYSRFLDAFFIGDMILGAGFILVAWATVRLLFPDRGHRLVSFMILCTLPAMVLFFGYVETYSVVLFTLSLYVWTGALFLRRQIPFAVVALVFLIQLLTHYLTILTLPSLLYLGYVGWKRGDSGQVLGGVATFSLAAFLTLASVGFDVENYFSQVPHKHYLPFTPPDDIDERYSSPYTMFSPYHLTDLANMGLLLAGAASYFIFTSLVPRRRTESGKPAHRSVDGHFLLLACGPLLLFTLVAKFDLGAARDWDVIAPYSYILTLFALVRYFQRHTGADDLRPALLVGGVHMLCSLLWFSVNSPASLSVERFRSLLDPRTIGQGGMYSGHLFLSRYYRQEGMDEKLSAALWENYLMHYPGDIRGYRNVLTNMRGSAAGAVGETMDGWRRNFGDNPVTRSAIVMLSLESGNLALEENRLHDAETSFARALAADSGSAAAWNNFGIVRARGGHFGEASQMFTRAVTIDTAFADAWFNLGRALVALGDEEGGRRAFVLSARHGNDAARRLLSEIPED